MDDDGAIRSEPGELVFDDERMVSEVAIALVATLAGRLGIERLAARLVKLRRDRPGSANASKELPRCRPPRPVESIPPPTAGARGSHVSGLRR